MLVPLRRKILRHMFSGYRKEKQEGAWMMNVVEAMECKMD